MEVETLKEILKNYFYLSEFDYDVDGKTKEDFLKNFAEENELEIEYKIVYSKDKKKTDDSIQIFKPKKENTSYRISLAVRSAKKLDISSNVISKSLLMRSEDIKAKKIVLSNREKYFSVSDGKYIQDATRKDYYILDHYKTEDLEGEYKNILKVEPILNELFDINCEELKFCPKQIGKAIVYQSVRYIKHPEHVSEVEYDFIKCASKGGFTYYEEGLHKGCVCYDFNSFYSDIMSGSYGFRFPIKEGKITTLKDISEIDLKNKIGIYRLNLKSKFNRATFRPNSEGYYTTYDIELMKKLKIEYEMLNVEKNALEYDEWLRGEYIFGGIMKRLYKLKIEHKNMNDLFKVIMSEMWGTLTKESKFEIPIDEVYENAMHRVIDFDPIKMIAVLSKEQPFNHFLARLKPFLLSMGRKQICKLSQKIIKKGGKVVRCFTDSVVVCNISEKKVNKICEINPYEMGCLKKEDKYEGDIQILDLNKITKIN